MKKSILFLLPFFLCEFVFAAGEMPALELENFTVIKRANKLDIKFSTSILTGGPYFTIEKSKDEKDFTKLIDTPAIESGSVYSDYFETDYQPYSGVSYYRIKQTDESGNFRYSQTVTYKEEESTATNNVNKTDAGETLLVLRDRHGNDFYTKMAVADLKKSSLTPQEMSPPVSEGTYHIISSSGDEYNNQKLIIK